MVGAGVVVYFALAITLYFNEAHEEVMVTALTTKSDTARIVCARYRIQDDLPAETGLDGPVSLPGGRGRIGAIRRPRPWGIFVHAEIRRCGMYTPIVENLSTRDLTVISDDACPRNLWLVTLGRVDHSDKVSLKRHAAFLRRGAIPIRGLRMPFDELVALTPAASERPHPR